MADQVFRIGKEFRFAPAKRTLERNGDEPVALPARAAQLLLVLIQERRRAVPKDELYSRVWSGLSVSENNLHQAIGALRRAFGDSRHNCDYIVTIPNVGYRLIADVEADGQENGSSPELGGTEAGAQSAAPAPSRRRWIAWAALAGALAATAFIVLPWRRARFAVPPFTNLQHHQDGGDEHAWLAGSLREFAIAAAGSSFDADPAASRVLAGSYAVTGRDRIRIRIGASEGTANLAGFADLVCELTRQASGEKPQASGLDSLAEGLAVWRKADPLGAIPLLRRAVAADPGHAGALSALAAALGEAGHSAESALLHERAAALSSDPLILARRKASTGDWRAAIDGFTRIWIRRPDRLESTLDLASAQFGARDAKAARETLDTSLGALGGAAAGSDPRVLLLSARIEGQFARMREVRELARKARESAHRQGMRWVEARAMLLESGAMLNLGDSEAAALRRQARALCERLGDRACVAGSWRVEGNEALGRGSMAEASGAYWKALQIAREIGNGTERLHVLNGLGAALMEQRQYAKAEATYKEGLGMDLARHGTDPGGFLIGLAGAVLAQGRRREAGDYAAKAMEHGNRAADQLTEAAATLLAASALGQPELFEKAIDLYARIGNPEQSKRALIQYAEFLADNGSGLEKAEQLLHRAGRLPTPLHREALEEAKQKLIAARSAGAGK